ncbi:nuclear transport factor 2 family protein [Vallitalea okinawensis]|uniref:nuclear transport factor 2 family protein n=1 Tax=Vallitalea okinawensis TaxID=2078660 RepID=UPI000CFDE221|nr:nuclear transport factor 2 family protein [Vallitalea okinawensis]
MPLNELVNHKDIQEVREVLKKFQEGYTNRNTDTLDSYMDDIFVNDDSMITVGTSRSEWCFGVHDLKNLVESDWKYWGDLVVNFEKAKINSKGSVSWFLADCTINWEDDDYNEWCNDLVADYFEDNGRFINYKPKSKLAMLNLQMAFIQQSKEHLGCNMPIRLSGGLIKRENQWLIHKLHFSAPMPSYPEWRIADDNVDSLKYYNQVKEKMKAFNDKFKKDSLESITELLNQLQSNYLDKATAVEDTINHLFLTNDDTYIVDPNENPAAFGRTNMENMILDQREKWDEMILNVHEAILNAEDDTVAITANGLFKKAYRTDELVDKEWNNIKTILQREGTVEDRLLEAQKQIAYTFKEVSFGEESLWEFRFEAIAIKECNQWRFHNIQFTFPSLYVYEGNYKMTPLL